MTNNNPPNDVTFAAAVVQSWLDRQQSQPGQGKVGDEVFAKMSAAERIEYCRQFDQQQFSGAKPNDRRTIK
jgi:hypothetical protein